MKIIARISIVLSLGFYAGFAFSQELSFQEDCVDGLNIPSNTQIYASENCPDIAHLVTCINHTGMVFASALTDGNIDSLKAAQQVQEFGANAIDSCTAACEKGDGGACFILAEAEPSRFDTARVLSISPELSLVERPPDEVDRTYRSVQFAARACQLEVGPACRYAGTQILINYWQKDQENPQLNTSCEQDSLLDGGVCEDGEGALQDLEFKEVNIDNPLEYFMKGCEHGDAFSCAQAFDFAKKYSDAAGDSFEYQFYVDRICNIGSKLMCKQYKNK